MNQMNFKMKLAAVAAFSALATSAFASEQIGDYSTVAAAEMSVEGAGILAEAGATVSTVFDGFAFDDAGNAALIYQTGTLNLAYIEQTTDAAGNYAYISQVSEDKADVAAVYQAGTNNRAVVNQY
jgi:Curlin associated repeat